MTRNRKAYPEIKLATYLPWDRFRTVESFTMLRAPSEMRVEIELGDAFMAQLRFGVPWDGKLYAYARPTQEFYDLCAGYGFSAGRSTILYFQDWEKKFLLEIEKDDGESRQALAFFVSSEDVGLLLERCCRIPEQRSSRQ